MKERGAKGHSLPTIHGYLAGRREPPLEFLLAAADVLGVREEWMVLGSGEPTSLEEEVAADEGNGHGLLSQLRDRYPSFDELPEGTHELFVHVLRRYALGPPEGHQLTESLEGTKTVVDLAGDLLLILDLPRYPITWGFEQKPSEDQQRHYVVAMLHAISLLLPERSRGQNLERRDGSSLPRLRRYIDRHLLKQV